VVVYGKVANSGVDVSVNNTEFKGLGVEIPVPSNDTHNLDDVIITGLQPNTSYVFASIGIDHDGNYIAGSTGIGATSRHIATLLPLPLPSCWAMIAITARQLGIIVSPPCHSIIVQLLSFMIHRRGSQC
jgi:hypothetical protein